MATTAEEILNMAYGKNKNFVPGQIGDEPDELRKLVGRSLQGLFAVGARINPLMFATSATQGGASGKWSWPSDVEAFIRIEDNADNSEIEVVPFDDRTAEEGLPAVYYMGRSWYPAGNANDPNPASDTLKYWYSKRPEIPANISTNLDGLWIDGYNELLASEVAIYLAIKMKEVDIINQLRTDRDEELRLFVAHLEHVVPIESRRFKLLHVAPSNAVIPLNRLVAGGTDVL